MKTKSILLEKLVDLYMLSFIISALGSNLFCILSLHKAYFVQNNSLSENHCYIPFYGDI
jgi:hypothetical protein